MKAEAASSEARPEPPLSPPTRQLQLGSAAPSLEPAPPLPPAPALLPPPLALLPPAPLLVLVGFTTSPSQGATQRFVELLHPHSLGQPAPHLPAAVTPA